MDSTASDPQPQHQQPHQHQNQQQPPPPPQSTQPQQQQSQHPSKPQAQSRPQQHQQTQIQQQQQQQPQLPQHQHPQHAHQGQPQAYQPAHVAQYYNHAYPRYAQYPQHYPPTYAYPPHYPPQAWPQQPPANYPPVQTQQQFAPSMVNSQPQPNVPHNRPLSQNIPQTGYNIERAQNQGLQQVNVISSSMISTAKPLTVRPRTKATLKTPDGKEIKLDDDSSTSKNPSTTTSTTSTKATPSTNNTTTAEHVHTFLQKVLEDPVDSKKSVTDGRRAEEKNNDTTNDKKSIDLKVGDKIADDKQADVKKADLKQGGARKVEFKHTDVKKAEDKKVEIKEVEIKQVEDKRAEDNCVNADKKVTVEKVDSQKKDISKEGEDTDDKENKIQANNEIAEQAKPGKAETEGSSTQEEKIAGVKEAEDEKEDDGSVSDDKDEGSNSLKYEPGQYHPITNTSGKKKYSREFLMDVRNRVEKADNITFPQSIRTDPFDLSERFGYARHTASRQNDPNRRQGQNNYSGRSSAGQEKQRIVIASSSLTQDVELKTTSNPWRPTKDAKEEVPEEVVDTEVLKKKFRSILNKLTPNNFDSLAQSVTKLNIDTESELGDVIDIVFAKALAEPGYCVLYGRMCSHLKENTAGEANFGSILLKRCQNQFQSDIYSGLNLDDRKKTIEDEQDPVAKKQLEEELYEEMYRCRMRGLGLIKFIGELYKIEMLNNAIMIDCVLRLLNDGGEEALECLCDLLVTIGEKLDRSSASLKSANAEKERSKKGASKANAYQGGQSLSKVVAGVPQQPKVDTQSLDYVFDQFHRIIKNNDSTLSKRIIFKLLDTCDLREKDKWQSKKTKDNNPKKIEEIRKAHEEKLEQEKRQNNAMGPRRSQEHRRLGPSGGSSNQISSLANESGGRGNLHQSASSHILRDHQAGEMRTNHNADTDRKDYQRSLLSINFLKNFTQRDPAQTSKPNISQSLRPASSLNKPRNA